MRFFRTPAQRRILQRYWQENKPFTLDTLLEKRILHSRLLGNLVLWGMERKSQIIHPIVGDPMYVGTTDSFDEWDRLYLIKIFSGFTFDCFYGNRYEHADIIPTLEEMIEEYRQSTAL